MVIPITCQKQSDFDARSGVLKSTANEFRIVQPHCGAMPLP
jgi:hypothetical protein